jgi:hypothetical protein
MLELEPGLNESRAEAAQQGWRGPMRRTGVGEAHGREAYRARVRPHFGSTWSGAADSRELGASAIGFGGLGPL